MANTIKSLIVTLILGLIIYYVTLPALNITSLGFWFFILSICFIYLIIYTSFFISNPIKIINRTRNIEFPLSIKVVLTSFFIIIIGIFTINFILSPIFFSKDYAKRIIVNQNTNFIDDIKEVDFNKIPLLDKASTTKLGDRTMGQQTSWVSQFHVSDLYTQINYNNEIIRVTPLEYDGLIKYFTNRKDGIKGYITVNSVNGQANLEVLNEGMKYMPSAYLNEDLYRKLRFTYPTLIFDEANFELDDNGNPYWIIPYIKYVGIGIRKDIIGVIILDPVTGDSTKYKVEDIPKWVDHVYNADLIIESLNDWGNYQNGFLNSIFGQKDVVNTTEGYNYLTFDDDVYLYTGITSVAADESNIGFVLTNLRTKETKYYNVPGAEEYSAMKSSEGLVQEKDYEATFPLLINLNNRPTYLMSLKDEAGLVKMYAFVDVEDYQKVVTTEASLGIEEAARRYLNEVSFDNSNANIITKEITINSIISAIIDGNTYYYITDTDNNRYSLSIKVNTSLIPFLSNDDKVEIKYRENNNINEIIDIKTI